MGLSYKTAKSFYSDTVEEVEEKDEVENCKEEKNRER